MGYRGSRVGICVIISVSSCMWKYLLLILWSRNTPRTCYIKKGVLRAASLTVEVEQ